MWSRHRIALSLIVTSLTLSGCSGGSGDGDAAKGNNPLGSVAQDREDEASSVPFSAGATPPPSVPDGAPALASASLVPASGSDAQGLIVFDPIEDGLIVSVEATGLDGGEHGMHIHEVGDCSALDASSAGDHFDPDGSKLGDLTAIESDEAGSAFVDVVASDLALWGDNDIVGRAIVIHSSEDPDVRIACGVIEGAAG